MKHATFLGILFAAGCESGVAVSDSPVATPVLPRPETALILPMALPSDIEAETAKTYRMLGRGALKIAFEERKLEVLTPAMTDAYATQKKLALDDPATWRKEVLSDLGRQMKATYIATLEVKEVRSEEGRIETAGGPPPPGGKLVTTATFEASVFEVKTGKFLYENVPHSHISSVGRPGPAQKQVDDERLNAFIAGTPKAFAAFLSARPLTKPTKAPKRPDGDGG